MRRFSRWALLPLLLQNSSCSSDIEFSRFSRIEGLRVISVVVEPPEIGAGAHTTITPTLSPGFEDASVAWAACLEPTVPAENFVNTDCFKDTPQPSLVQLGTSPTLDFQMPADIQVTDLGLPDSSTGYYLPVRWIVQKGGDKLLGFSRVRLSHDGQPINHNPEFDAVVRVEGGDDLGPEIMTPVDNGLTVAAGSKVRLRATVTPNSLETYTRVKDSQTLELETVTEQARLYWFSTAGEFSANRTGFTIDTIQAASAPSTELDLAKDPPADLPADVSVWAVATDERGGQAVRSFQLRIQ